MAKKIRENKKIGSNKKGVSKLTSNKKTLKAVPKISVEFYRPNFYNNKVLLIDGLGRTGKSLFGPLLSSFQKVELERIEPILEMLPILDSFGKIDHQSAIAVLRQEIDMKLYDSAISRNVNFRLSDHSSAFNSSNLVKYLKRLRQTDGDVVVNRLKEEQLIFQNQTHDLLGRCQLYFDAFGTRLRILEIVRHPIDVVNSFFQYGWGERYGTDPRAYALSINYNDQALPWYAAGWEEKYLKLKPMERIIEFVSNITKQNEKGYSSLNQERKTQVMLLPFELFVTDPYKYLPQIEQFLGTTMSSKTGKALNKQRCPRKLDLCERNEKLAKIKELASPAYYEKLLRLSQDYEEKYLKTELYAKLREEITALVQEEAKNNPVTYNTKLPYQSYDRIGFTGLRWSPEKRIKEYDLQKYIKSKTVLDIGSNMGFLSSEMVLQGAKEVVGIEPQPYLVKISEITAKALGVEKKTTFHDLKFEDFTSQDQFEVVLSFAAFHTADGRERQAAEDYFGRIYNLLKENGHVIFESVSYNRAQKGEHYTSNQEALRLLRSKFKILTDESRPSGSPGWFRDFFVGQKISLPVGEVSAAEIKINKADEKQSSETK